MEKLIQFERDGYLLSGVLHLPEEITLKGGVLFLHGFGGNRSEVGRLFVRTARQLEKRGIASLRFDFVGSGDSEGEDIDCSIDSEVVDAVAAYRVLREETGLPEEKIGLIGYSLGGCVGALLSARIRFPAMVLWAPVGDLEDQFLQKAAMAPEKLKELDSYDTGVRRVGKKFIRDVFQLKPYEEISQYPGKLLLIHGSEDDVVSVDHSQKLFESAHGAAERVELLLIEGTNHAFQYRENSETLIEQTTAWLGEHLPADNG